MWKTGRARERDVMIETGSDRCHIADFEDEEMALGAKECG